MKIKLLFINLILIFPIFSQSFDEYDKVWSTYFGGQGTQFYQSVIDSEGNIIAVGIVIAHNQTLLLEENYYNQFTTNPQAGLLYNSALVVPGSLFQSVFAKFSPDGMLLQAGYLPFETYHLEIDTADYLYISGNTHLNTQGVGNVWQTTPLPEYENDVGKSILAKLNPDFTINWLTYIPTKGSSIITLDENFNIYGVSQAMNTVHSVTTAGTFQTNFETGAENGYLFKLTNQGQLEWATYHGFTTGLAIAYSQATGELITSFARNDILSSFDSYYYTAGALQQTVSRQIISKFDANNGQRTYGTYFGQNNIGIQQITCNEGDYYFLGNATSALDNSLISSGAHQTIHNGPHNIYLGRFEADLSLMWGTYISGNDYDECLLVPKLIFKDKTLYFTGMSYSDNIITSSNTYQNNNQGDSDLLMMKFSIDGEMIWGSYFGGNKQENYGSITPLNDHTFYFVGNTHSLTNISTPSSFQESMSFHPDFPYSDHGNGFVAKFSTDNIPPPIDEPEEEEEEEEEEGIDDDLAVQTIYNAEDFTLYPNPSNGNITIKGNLLKGKNSLSVYNSVGQKVFSTVLENTTEYNLKLDFLSSGVYYLDINSTLKKKIVIR